MLNARLPIPATPSGPIVVALACLAAAALGCGTAGTRPPADTSTPRWWKGNLHTHSLWSDGDDYPEMIVDWYKRHGYRFLAISDHNTLARGEKWIDVENVAGGRAAYRRYLERFGDEWVERRMVDGRSQVRLKTLQEYRRLFEEPGRFLVIQSEEISDWFQRKQVHVNATNIAEPIEPQGGGSVREVLQNNIDAVLAQRERVGRPMFPHVNHPNFVWAVTVEDLIALEGERFFEVYNGHPLVHNEGDERHPSTERMWDILLTRRLERGDPVMYGLATDDAHNYHAFASNRSNPGRGWVMVRARELTPRAIIHAMEAGDFYATTGVELADLRREGDRITIEIEPEAGVSYTTRFIGTRRGYERLAPTTRAADTGPTAVRRRYSDEIGVVLAEVRGASASYRMRGDELYVRAKIISSKPKANPYREGEVEAAWVQPILPGRDRRQADGN